LEYPAQAPQTIVTGLSESIAISNTVFMGGFKFIDICEMRVVALASVNWTAGTAGVDAERRSDYTYSTKPFFYVNKSGSDNPVSIRFRDMSFEGNHIATGFVVFDNAKHRCGIWNTYGHAPKEFGVYATDKNGDLTIEGNRWCQYSYGETNFDDWNYRTATLIDVRTTDSRLINNTPFYCLVPIRAWGSKMQIIGNHPFNGSVDQGTPAKAIPFGTESVSLELRTKNSVITNNYIDNGVVHWDVDQGYGEAASVFANNTCVAQTNTQMSCFIKFYTDEASRTLDGFNFTNNTFSENTSVLAIEVSFDTTSGSWAGVNERGYISSGNVRSSPTTGATSSARGLLALSYPGVMAQLAGGPVSFHTGAGFNGGDSLHVATDATDGRVSLIGPAVAGGVQDYGDTLTYEPGIGWQLGAIGGVLSPILTQLDMFGAGKIIEYGGTDDSFYIKFSDGRLFNGGVVNLGSCIAVGAGTWASPYRTAVANFTFALAFATYPRAPALSVSMNTGTAANRLITVAHQSTGVGSVANIQATRIGEATSTNDVLCHVSVWGRWS